MKQFPYLCTLEAKNNNMAIPKFEDFLYPFLLHLKEKDISNKEMKEILISHFALTEEDCLLRTKGGSAFQIDDRIGWVRQDRKSVV